MIASLSLFVKLGPSGPWPTHMSDVRGCDASNYSIESRNSKTGCQSRAGKWLVHRCLRFSALFDHQTETSTDGLKDSCTRCYYLSTGLAEAYWRSSFEESWVRSNRWLLYCEGDGCCCCCCCWFSATTFSRADELICPVGVVHAIS